MKHLGAEPKGNARLFNLLVPAGSFYRIARTEWKYVENIAQEYVAQHHQRKCKVNPEGGTQTLAGC